MGQRGPGWRWSLWPALAFSHSFRKCQVPARYQPVCPTRDTLSPVTRTPRRPETPQEENPVAGRCLCEWDMEDFQGEVTAELVLIKMLGGNIAGRRSSRRKCQKLEVRVGFRNDGELLGVPSV